MGGIGNPSKLISYYHKAGEIARAGFDSLCKNFRQIVRVQPEYLEDGLLHIGSCAFFSIQLYIAGSNVWNWHWRFSTGNGHG
jgi:hypothetical protein